MSRIALFAIVMAAACSIDDFVEYGGVIGVDDGASEGVAGSIMVDGSRDAHLVLKTGAALDVPKGAVDHGIELSMERPADQDAIPLVKPLKDYQAIVSLPYVLTPHGTKFREPVTIEIPITKQTDKKLVMAWIENENDKTWKKLGDPIIKDGVAKLDIDHFSVVILLEEARANLSGSSDSGGESSANDGGSSGTSAGSGTDAAAAPSSDSQRPSGPLDAGSSSGSDVSTPSRDAESAPLPFPFPDGATIMLPPGVGTPAPADAGAGTAGSVDAGAAKTYDASF